MPRIQELIMRDPEPIDVFNHEVRDDISALVGALSIEMAPSTFPEPRSGNNPVSLTKGDHGGARLVRPNTHIRAIPAGVRMTRKLVATKDCEIDGVFFTSMPNTGVVDELVDIQGVSVVVFRGCVFEKASVDEAVYVAVADGAKAILVGCIFKGNTGVVGDLFSHAGAAGNVQLVGCYNKTTHSYGANTTQTACL